jgi:hypothetical protein
VPLGIDVEFDRCLGPPIIESVPQFVYSHYFPAKARRLAESERAPAREVHIILDDLPAHKSLVRDYLASYPNVHFHFTLTYSSWLNQVEIWSSKVQRDVAYSGRMQEFPEVDRAEFFGMEEAKKKINPAQVKLLLELEPQKGSPLLARD